MDVSSRSMESTKVSSIKKSKGMAQILTGPVVWAIDPAKLDRRQVEDVQDLLDLMKFKKVLPVTVFTPIEAGWIMPLSKKDFVQATTSMEERVFPIWDEFEIKNKKGGVLITEANSLREKVAVLISYAQSKKASAIIIGTGGRKRSHILGLGSFAETLISYSPIPVLILGEAVRELYPIKRILFPTDLSAESKKFFNKVCDYASAIGAEVLVYHSLEVDKGPQAFGIPWGYEVKWLDEFWHQHEKSVRQIGNKWIEEAHQKNIEAEFICDHRPGDLTESLLDTIYDQKIDLVAIGLKRGPISQILLGRTVREIFANSTCPVMTLHSDLKKPKLQ